uniref:EF-hand domain-containing protein n=1 Tax=Wuchereria bancrofti TaxID=6293 RepID=A0AAF5PIA0_WUCBA
METAFETVTMTDGTLAISYKKHFVLYTSTSEWEESRTHQNVMEVTSDDGNNNDSLVIKVMDPGGLSEVTDDKNCIRGAAATQQNSSRSLLPPISASYIFAPISKRNLCSVISAAMSPQNEVKSTRISIFPATTFDESKIGAINSGTEIEISEHLNVLPSLTLKSPNEKDVMWNNQRKLIMDHICKTFENAISSDILDDKNESSCISPIHLNPDIFTRLLETPKKFKWFEKFEQDQENAWDCSRQTPISPSDSNYDKNPYAMFPYGNTQQETLVEKNIDTLEKPQILDSSVLQEYQQIVITNPEALSNDEILDDLNVNDISWYTSSTLSKNGNALTPRKMEEKRNESSFEMLLSSDLDSSTVHKVNILNETDPTSFSIPRFHYPCGIPHSGKESCKNLKAVKGLFYKYNDRVDLSHMKEICLASGLCPLWKQPLYNCISTPTSNFINFDKFASWWKKFEENAHDETSRFVYILTNGKRNYLIADDFKALVQDLIETLPSLSSLKEAVAFHQPYIETVIARIFWNVCHSWKKYILTVELRLSNLLKAIKLLEREEVNEECEIFSYKHFYVIYCNFYMLDKGEKNYLTPSDLSLYSNSALTNLVVQRIFSGAVSLNSSMKRTIDYIAFVNFLLAEVDKSHPKSIEYWFRIMDLNGDGRISFDEMEQFYNEIVANVIRMGMDVITFSNLINMLKDMIPSHSSTYFTLSDLKRSPPVACYFFNTFINWVKHIAQESCPPDNRNRFIQGMDPQFSDWNRFCKMEYKILVADLMNSEEETTVW